MAMTSTRACNMNSLPTNRMRSLLAIWLEMASGSRNWDGFLIGNGWLTGKTWEKMICSQCLPLKVIPSTHLPYWVARLESHQRHWQSHGRKFGRPLERENGWKWMISWLVRFKSDTFWVHNRPSKPHHLAESLENIGHADDLTCLEDLVASSCVFSGHVGLLKLSIASM